MSFLEDETLVIKMARLLDAPGAERLTHPERLAKYDRDLKMWPIQTAHLDAQAVRYANIRRKMDGRELVTNCARTDIEEDKCS